MKNQPVIVNNFIEINKNEKPGSPFSFYTIAGSSEPLSLLQLFHCAVQQNKETDPFFLKFKDLVSRLELIQKEPFAPIPRIYDWGLTQADSLPYIEMERIEGTSLEEQLQQQGCFSKNQVIQVAEQIARTLTYCHNLNLVHGNLTMRTVRHDSHSRRYRLTSFGLSTYSSEQLLSAYGEAPADRLAPEYCTGTLLLQTDVYQLGLVLYQLLTGQTPERAAINTGAPKESFTQVLLFSREKVLPEGLSAEQKSSELQLPNWLIELVFKSLMKDPTQRFANAGKLYSYILINRVGDNKKETSQPIQAIPAPKKRAPVTPVPEPVVTAIQTTPKPEPVGHITVQKPPKAVRKHMPSGVWFLAALFLGAAGYFLLHHQSGRSEGVVKQPSLAQQPAGITTQPEDGTALTKVPDAVKPIKDTLAATSRSYSMPVASKRMAKAHPRRDSVVVPQSGALLSRINHPWKPEGTTVDTHSGLGEYKVVSVAHFYNEPDENTRRNAFINHWNNAVLTPIEEKNDFVYIVFRNIWGQTSKGWIRKRDIIRVDE